MYQKIAPEYGFFFSLFSSFFFSPSFLCAAAYGEDQSSATVSPHALAPTQHTDMHVRGTRESNYTQVQLKNQDSTLDRLKLDEKFSPFSGMNFQELLFRELLRRFFVGFGVGGEKNEYCY